MTQSITQQPGGTVERWHLPARSGLWRMLTEGPARQRMPKGIDALWNRAAGTLWRTLPWQQRLMRRAGRVLAMERELAELTTEALRDEAQALRATFRRGRDKARDVDRAFAVLREVASRELGMKPFRVQVAAGLGMHLGCVVEMATGEGKTLSASLPAVIAGWRGHGCHVLTVNDYLAKRDAELMGPIYRFCGLRVAWITQEAQPDERREAYAADVTYTTNKEVAADFLRDRLMLGRRRGLTPSLMDKVAGRGGGGPDRLVMRGLEHAIVDEADSILVDEAVTPLIISGAAPNTEQTECYAQAADIAERMRQGRDYRVIWRYRDIELTRRGRDRLERIGERIGGLWTGHRRAEELIHQALNAKELIRRDKHYVIKKDEEEGKDKIVIVDEFTGRLMPDRTWSNGLHQAVEAKEGLEINPPKETQARISFQRFFRLYRRLAGMTGTAAEACHELWQIYRLPVVPIPTHRPCLRVHLPDRIHDSEDEKWAAVVEEVAAVHATGRPVLIGTRTVEDSERLSRMLEQRLLRHHVINAIRHEEEAAIIAEAGQRGRITVATNMAGRGTDIKLGPGVAELGGLHVIATVRHEARRIDRQLFGRAGRQGDPGSALAITSLEDELIRRHAPPWARTAPKRKLGPRVFRAAQQRAERLALTQRKSVLRTDDWLDEFLGFAGRE